jgi:hypothetical protein
MSLDFYGDGWAYQVHLKGLREIARHDEILYEFGLFLQECVDGGAS